MKHRFTSRLGLLLVVLSMLTSSVPAQTTTTGRLTGTVTDAQGAVVPNAQIVVKNEQTNTEFKVKASDEGAWSIPSVPNGVYVVTITASGFKSTVIQNVKVDTASAQTVNASLEVGGASEQVVVSSGGSVIQSESANISSTIVGRQIGELPWATRDAMQLVLTLPGVQTPGTPRTSSVNGLPKSGLNITLDGANVQDNLLKSSDGFFTSIQAKSDAVEEVTVSTATPGAESAGEGAVHIKFVTKAGTNDFRGGLFWQHRNTWLNSNYYFNNIDGLPRDHLILNQAGGNIGGPIIIPKLFNGRDKAFFFINFEEFRLPQTYNGARTVLTEEAQRGIFTYLDRTNAANPVQRKVDLLAIAAARGHIGTIDPTISKALAIINEAAQKGSLTSRIGTNDDFNRLDLAFQDPGRNIRRFPTLRLDFNVTDKHHLEFIHNYQHYFSDPDGVNGQINQFPGTGIVVGSPGITGSIYRNAFSFVLAERWTITNRIINEIRLTSSGNGATVFTREFAPGLFDFLGGAAIANDYVSNFHSRSTQSRRHTPTRGLNDNVSWLKGSHSLNFGLAFTRIDMFQQSVGRQVVPLVTLGIASGDPVASGAGNIFTTGASGNFPGSSSTQRAQAQALYSLLVGRVRDISRSASLDENTQELAPVPFTERNHQHEWGLYGQDSWKMRPNLTLNFGLRWELQPSAFNDNDVYTRPGFDSLFGVSGQGNLFKPGVFENVEAAAFRKIGKDENAYKTHKDLFAPSIGFAYTPNWDKGILGKFTGGAGQTVLRGGYSISYTREGFNSFVTIFGANEGPTVTLGLNPTTNPAEFGAPGSVLLRDGNLPSRAIPESNFPLPVIPGSSVNEFHPNLRPGYVQSYSFGIQRELAKNTALEVRYVGNHGARLWRQYGLNEVNIFENGFLDEFKVAARNLAIAKGINPNSNNFSNQGLPGQAPIPILQGALGNLTNDLTFATMLLRGEAGRLAHAIASSFTRMNNLISRGLVPFVTVPDPRDPTKALNLSNFFVVNPLVPPGSAITSNGNSFLMDNGAGTTYNSLQIDLRRRMSSGLLVQGSYVWSKSLTNMFNSSSIAFSQPTTLRDLEFDKGPSPWDVRHALKFDWINELPIGPGRRFLNGGNAITNKLLEGWQWGGVARIQSGSPLLLTSGRFTFNNRESGVVLHNISTKELQEKVKIRKETVCDPVTGVCRGVVFWLPQSIINNTLAAFEITGTLDPNAPYIGPPTEAGKLGNRIYLYGPWQTRIDLNLMKRTRITERTNFEFRVQFLNAFNNQNFLLGAAGNDFNTEGITANFGQTRSAYRDITVSGTNDPGGRLVEFQIRLNF